jgi:hypothetical protein
MISPLCGVPNKKTNFFHRWQQPRHQHQCITKEKDAIGKMSKKYQSRIETFYVKLPSVAS